MLFGITTMGCLCGMSTLSPEYRSVALLPRPVHLQVQVRSTCALPHMVGDRNSACWKADLLSIVRWSWWAMGKSNTLINPYAEKNRW